MSLIDTTAVRQGLEKCLEMIPETMTGLASAFRSSLARINEPMQLAIIGKISSSKSTLVNALLGKDNLMATGAKEVTYNVGWLRYGAPDSDIVIHHKDGKAPTRRKRSDFTRLSASATDAEIDNISYIETFDDSELLRDINIIDTPGLDAERGKDSQNTLDFISNVRPDAVLMLFTHSPSENTLDVVRKFNAGSNFNPLNAIGILGKIDVLWQESIPRTKTALEIGRRMSVNRMEKDKMLKRTLFDLYPISALLFMAAQSVTRQDVDDVVKAYNAIPDKFMKALGNVKGFVAHAEIPLAEERRRQLAAKLGIYGIWLIARRVKNGEDYSLQAIKQLFWAESGAETFMTTLRNHFGTRSRLIKLESIYQHLHQQIQASRSSTGYYDRGTHSLLDTVEQRLAEVFEPMLHEHVEYEMLRNIYDGKLDLDPEVTAEFARICGEKGTTAPERLGMPAATAPEQLEARAHARERYWRSEIALEPDPEERAWMKVILKSYALLRQRIVASRYQLEQIRAFLGC